MKRIHTFREKNVNGGGAQEFHLKWGGHEMIIQNGGCTHVPPKMGVTHVRPKAARKKGTPLKLFLVPSLRYYFGKIIK